MGVTAVLVSRGDASQTIGVADAEVLIQAKKKLFMPKLLEYGGRAHLASRRAIMAKAIWTSTKARKAWREAPRRAQVDRTEEGRGTLTRQMQEGLWHLGFHATDGKPGRGTRSSTIQRPSGTCGSRKSSTRLKTRVARTTSKPRARSSTLNVRSLLTMLARKPSVTRTPPQTEYSFDVVLWWHACLRVGRKDARMSRVLSARRHKTWLRPWGRNL